MTSRAWRYGFWVAFLLVLAVVLWNVWQPPAPPPVPATSTPTIAVTVLVPTSTAEGVPTVQRSPTATPKRD